MCIKESSIIPIYKSIFINFVVKVLWSQKDIRILFLVLDNLECSVYFFSDPCLNVPLPSFKVFESLAILSFGKTVQQYDVHKQHIHILRVSFKNWYIFYKEQVYVLYRYLKFIYSEKATKFCEIFPLLLTTVHTVKSKAKISRNFVAFSEYMNFNLKFNLFVM